MAQKPCQKTLNIGIRPVNKFILNKYTPLKEKGKIMSWSVEVSKISSEKCMHKLIEHIVLGVI